MDLRKIARKAAKRAFEKQIGTLATAITYRSRSAAASHNTSTGVITRPETTLSNVKALLSDFSAKEITEAISAHIEIKQTDRKCEIAGLSLGAITPKASDRVDIPGEGSWEIVRVWTDPADAVWGLQIRRP